MQAAATTSSAVATKNVKAGLILTNTVATSWRRNRYQHIGGFGEADDNHINDKHARFVLLSVDGGFILIEPKTENTGNYYRQSLLTINNIPQWPALVTRLDHARDPIRFIPTVGGYSSFMGSWDIGPDSIVGMDKLQPMLIKSLSNYRCNWESSAGIFRSGMNLPGTTLTLDSARAKGEGFDHMMWEHRSTSISITPLLSRVTVDHGIIAVWSKVVRGTCPGDHYKNCQVFLMVSAPQMRQR